MIKTYVRRQLSVAKFGHHIITVSKEDILSIHKVFFDLSYWSSPKFETSQTEINYLSNLKSIGKIFYEFF